MAQLICGMIFVIIGAALVIHNDELVRRSSRFYGSISPNEFGDRLLIERRQCVVAGAFSAAMGFWVLSGF